MSSIDRQVDRYILLTMEKAEVSEVFQRWADQHSHRRAALHRASFLHHRLVAVTHTHSLASQRLFNRLTKPRQSTSSVAFFLFPLSPSSKRPWHQGERDGRTYEWRGHKRRKISQSSCRSPGVFFVLFFPGESIPFRHNAITSI